MSVISLTVIEDAVQILEGVPKTITITASVPCTIFYTLDGTTPTINSSVYVSTLQLPQQDTVELAIWATNGTDSSAIITNTYGPDFTKFRKSHASVANVSSVTSSAGPFGSQSTDASNATYGNPSAAAQAVDDPSLTQIPNDFDGSGNPAFYTNEAAQNYQQIYSTTNANGESGRNIGNLPGHVTLTQQAAAPESSNKSDTLFNPKALVIYQDTSKDKPDDPVSLNRQFFSLENAEKIRDGALLFNTGEDALTTTGSFVRSFVNPRDNTITYYYYDNNVGRWIISKQPYTQKDPNINNLSGMVFGREQSAGKVFKWVPFARRVLF